LKCTKVIWFWLESSGSRYVFYSLLFQYGLISSCVILPEICELLQEWGRSSESLLCVGDMPTNIVWNAS